jgi:quercetin dioxygenase-like cupin family protein
VAGDCFYASADVVHGVRALEDGALIDVFTPVRKDFLMPGLW